MRLCLFAFLIAGGMCGASAAAPPAAAAPDYAADVAPLLKQYCAACHNAEEREGKFSVESYEHLLAGGKNGAVLTPGEAASSRLVRVLTGEAKPRMPPPENEAPTAAQVDLLRLWIQAGAHGPAGQAPDPKSLVTPRVPVLAAAPRSIHAVAVSPGGDRLAVARYGSVEIYSWPEKVLLRELSGHRGNVHSVSFSASGEFLVAAGGEAGLFGEARLWRLSDFSLVRTFEGHRDAFYDCEFSPSGEVLAAAGYDGRLSAWRRESGESLFSIVAHNGAVLDLAFHPQGNLLATASADRTVKLWEIPSGTRLETFVEPLKDQLALAFHPRGGQLAAAGADHRVRVWRISESGREGTNRLLVSRFAHEGTIFRLVYSPNGETLVTSGEEGAVKVWQAADVAWRATLPQPVDTPALAVAPDNRTLFAGRRDGEWTTHDLGRLAAASENRTRPLPEAPPEIDYGPQPAVEQLPKTAEVEPNDGPGQATPLALPGVATGRLFDEPGQPDRGDLFRFSAVAGEQWIFETKAARAGSPLDTRLEILSAEGKPVPSLKLQAVRASEVEFRPMDSNQRGVRLANWEEMLLNDYVYLQGDVMKHYRQRQGPDSDANFYPHDGNRHSYFGTSPRAHALGEPAYVVVPYPADAPLEDNGLPVFTLHFENDDDGSRQLGTDSTLTFIPPATGEYLVRVSDSRGFAGEKFSYELVARRPRPDFSVTVEGAGATVNAGSGKEIKFTARRSDNFHGPIRLELKNAPPFWQASLPTEIEAGHLVASCVLSAPAGAAPPTPEQWQALQITATASIFGREITKPVGGLGELKLAPRPKLVAHLELEGSPRRPPPAERAFQMLVPLAATAQNGATLAVQGDHSLLAAGTNADHETYTVTARSEAPRIRALRLDVLGHASLPGKAPGRAGTNGNFVLSEFRVTAAPLAHPEQAVPLKFASVEADYTQPGWQAAGLIDGNPKTGWAIAVNDAKNGYPVMRFHNSPSHYAVFELAEPLAGFPGGTLLTFTLEHASDVKVHNLGCFRLALAGEERPPPEPLPESPELTMAPGGSITCRLRVERHGFDDRVQFDINNLPHGIIVDNIGLSGVLVPERETERQLFLRAEPWVGETSRLFYAVAKVEGNQVSLPIRLHVRAPQ